jgi:hypothetical protein
MLKAAGLKKSDPFPSFRDASARENCPKRLDAALTRATPWPARRAGMDRSPFASFDKRHRAGARAQRTLALG